MEDLIEQVILINILTDSGGSNAGPFFGTLIFFFPSLFSFIVYIKRSKNER
jgi:hypothetical protein